MPSSRRPLLASRAQTVSQDSSKVCKVAHPALRHGSYTTLHASGPVYVFARYLARNDQPADHLIVALNTDRTTRVARVEVKDWLADGTPVKDVWSGEAAVVESGVLRLRLAPRSGVVLEV